MLPWAIFSKFKSEPKKPCQTLQRHNPLMILEPIHIKGLLKYLSGADIINLLLVTRSCTEMIAKELYFKPTFSSTSAFIKFVHNIKSKHTLYPYPKYVGRLYLDQEISNDLLIGDLQLLLECLPYLEEFSLIGCLQGSNLLISMLSTYTPSLTYLRLQGTTITDSMIGLVCGQLVDLVHLNLEFSSISVSSLKIILSNASKLTHLNLSYCISSNNNAWGKPISSKLTSLILKQSDISDEGLSWISASCPFLDSLILDGCTRLSDNGIYSISSHCKRLDTLSLNFCFGITDISLQALSIHSCKSLKILKCHGCGITSKGIEMLNQACKLTCIEYGF